VGVWQLVCVYMHCIDLLGCKAASVVTINSLANHLLTKVSENLVKKIMSQFIL